MSRVVAFILSLLIMPIVCIAGAKSGTVLDAIPTPPIFQNPFMAANNFSEVHFNSFQTDTTSVSGPASAGSQTVQQGLLRPIAQIAATIAFNSSGQILTIRVGPSHTTAGEDVQSLLLIDPVTLKVLAETDLPPRQASGGPVSFAGGGYFYIDNLDRVVAVTANQQIRIYKVQNNQFELVQAYDLSAQISGTPVSVLPDSAGNLWFNTDQANVGYVNPSSGTINIVNLRNLTDADPDADAYVKKLGASHAVSEVWIGNFAPPGAERSTPSPRPARREGT